MKPKTPTKQKIANRIKSVVGGSASSEPDLIAQPQMWVDWYKIVYGGNEQEAKRAWGRKMYLFGN